MGVRKFAGAFVKKTDKSFSNGYTGYQGSMLTNSLTIGGSFAAVGIMANASYSASRTENGVGGFNQLPTRAAKTGQIGYGGAPGIMDADGVGTEKQAPNLGATGDLVFGLHNGRRG